MSHCPAQTRKAIRALSHELEHLQKKKLTLDGHVQTSAVADKCIGPHETLKLIGKRWALKGRKTSRYWGVIEDAVKGQAYSNLLLQQRGVGSRVPQQREQ